MLPIIDKPAIHYAVEEAVNAGITDIIFITGRGKRAIEDYFDHSYELEHTLELKGKTELLHQMQEISDMADIVYLRQKEPLGLGHAVLRARDVVGDEPFVVILPDVLMADKGEFLKEMVSKYEKTGKSVIGVQEVPEDKVSSYGIIDPDGGGDNFMIKGMVEKPKPEEAPSNLSVFGRYLFTPKLFEELEKTEPGAGGEIQLTDAAAKLIKSEGIYGATYEGDYFDTGDKLGFLKATFHMALNNDEFKEDLEDFVAEKLKKR
jgi:UTP--glucose-1-phosphate uridylyltransferase